MAYQSVFKRYELKYMLTLEQKEKILQEIKRYMELDKYGRTTIRNIYFDTDNYRLIRRSMDKPHYKEKLRIRSYCKVQKGSTVFVELKKKYDGVVYKRRISMSEEEAISWVCMGNGCSKQNQISREIDYFMDFYGSLTPKVFLSYEREAYYCRDGGDLRITFDDNILARTEALSLEEDVFGTALLDKDKVLMEIKCSGGIPFWLARALSENKIYKASFSKYGTAYEKIIYQKNKGE
ncbi:MAG: polyphosphate polymerase domain-containing protein [Clostridia bacterium]|nr:polyphosphate polymerase domain-containing protein [Clostridia bacterium]